MPPKLTHGHRAVLQVAKVETVTDTVFSQTRTRHKLWLSDGNRWTIAFASELAGATAGCLVRVLKYHSTNELNIHEMELVGPPQPLIGVPTSVQGSPLPAGAVPPPQLPPPPPVAEVEARLLRARRLRLHRSRGQTSVAPSAGTSRHLTRPVTMSSSPGTQQSTISSRSSTSTERGTRP